MPSDNQLEQMKQKYASVLTAIEQQQIRLIHRHIQDNKPFLRGCSLGPSQEQGVGSNQASEPEGVLGLERALIVDADAKPVQFEGANVPGGQQRTYTVKAGDALSEISKELYGDAGEYMKLFEANRSVLSDANKISPDRRSRFQRNQNWPLSDFLGILEQYRDASTGAPPARVERDYSQVAQCAPPSDLASGLAEAFRSDQTPPFSRMLGTLFSNSTGQQRAGILNQLLGAVGPGMLASGGLSRLAGLRHGGNKLTPEQADQIPTETVQQLAEHAEKQNPSIVDRASEFYAQHPTLVKALGAGSLALIMSHLSKK